MNCRICQQKLTSPIVTLENMPLTDAFVNDNFLAGSNTQEFLEDIIIYECDNCRFVQNPNNFDYGSYYNDYNYSSGHSDFVKNFMREYAKKTHEYLLNNADNLSELRVLEVGSGDGEQLKEFLHLGFDVLGIEPSDFLVKEATKSGVKTIKSLYDKSVLDQQYIGKFDCILSSFTFDHMPNPTEYLDVSYKLLKDGGLITFEIHDLDKIKERGEFCLFEHEHTIYLNADDVSKLLEASGFRIISINPISQSHVRANSLIVFAQKTAGPCTPALSTTLSHSDSKFDNLQTRIDRVTSRLNSWIEENSKYKQVVGYGVGGRGVMTLANVSNAGQIAAMFDANYQSGVLYTPKTHIPIFHSDDARMYCDAIYIVFSFGYFDEISEHLQKCGVAAENIISLGKFYE